MSLRARINLVVAGLMLLMMAVMMAVDLLGTRMAVREEISASHRIAAQLVREVAGHYGGSDPRELAQFLARLGRVRANEMVLSSASGALLYQSPPSIYKQGRDAPAWYAWLVRPPEEVMLLPLRGATLMIRSNPTRAVLDGWDDMKAQAAGTLALLLLVNGVVFVLVGRWLAPLAQVRAALARIGQGDLAVRMPPLRGAEAAAMGQTVNRMAQALQERQQATVQAAQAEARLAAERRFVHDVQARIEAERRDLAATLHDEFGQSLTAVRALSHTLVQQCAARSPPTGAPSDRARRAAALLVQATDEMYASMHRLVPRLRPPALDRLGLAEALADLVGGLRQQHPELVFDFEAHGLETGAGVPPTLPEALQIGVYRMVQEALNNAIKHARATRVSVALRQAGGRLSLRVADDGVGMAEPGPVTGRFGLYGMIERAQALGGGMRLANARPRGLVVEADLPVAGDAAPGAGQA